MPPPPRAQRRLHRPPPAGGLPRRRPSAPRAGRTTTASRRRSAGCRRPGPTGSHRASAFAASTSSVDIAFSRFAAGRKITLAEPTPISVAMNAVEIDGPEGRRRRQVLEHVHEAHDGADDPDRRREPARLLERRRPGRMTSRHPVDLGFEDVAHERGVAAVDDELQPLAGELVVDLRRASASRASSPSRRACSASETSSETRACRSGGSALSTIFHSFGMRFIDAMPTLASVTPVVPPMMMISAGMLMNEAGLVPSIIALSRIATVATTIPMPVAAFIALGSTRSVKPSAAV